MIFLIWNFFPASFVSSYLIIINLHTVLILESTLSKRPDCASNLETWSKLQYNGY